MNNNILKNKIGLDVEHVSRIKDIFITNRLKYSYLLSDDNIDLDIKILDVNTQLKGKKIEKNNFDYTLMMKYNNFSTYLNFDFKSKIGLGFIVFLKILIQYQNY